MPKSNAAQAGIAYTELRAENVLLREQLAEAAGQRMAEVDLAAVREDAAKAWQLADDARPFVVPRANLGGMQPVGSETPPNMRIARAWLADYEQAKREAT